MSDLTDKEWSTIEPIFTKAKKGKHLQKHSKRKLVNVVRYLSKTGCQWRMLPKDFPKYKTTSSFYQLATKNGLWEKITDTLVQMTRIESKRNATPSHALIDSQSTKTTSASEEREYDGGKKIKGHKRHLITDVMGNLLKVVVGATNVHDTVAGCEVFRSVLEKYPSILGVCGDAGRGTFVGFVSSLGKKCECFGEGFV